MNLSQSLSRLGRRAEATGILEQAFGLYRQSLGASDLRTLLAQNLLAGHLYMLGEVGRAAQVFEEAVPVGRAGFPESVELGRSLLGLASCRSRLGQHDEAAELATEGLALTVKASGGDTEDVALAYSTVAEVHRMAGHSARALPLYRKGRAIYEKILGPEHPRVATVLSQEGVVLMNDGKYSLAAASMSRSLEMLARRCPDCRFEQWVGETNLGRLRLREGKYDEAARLLTHALSLEEQYGLGRGGDMLTTLRALAEARERQGRRDEAAALRSRADSASFRP
jgi:tetratricopeptide (TPR) repeat protein